MVEVKDLQIVYPRTPDPTNALNGLEPVIKSNAWTLGTVPNPALDEAELRLFEDKPVDYFAQRNGWDISILWEEDHIADPLPGASENLDAIFPPADTVTKGDINYVIGDYFNEPGKTDGIPGGIFSYYAWATSAIATYYDGKPRYKHFHIDKDAGYADDFNLEKTPQPTPPSEKYRLNARWTCTTNLEPGPVSWGGAKHWFYDNEGGPGYKGITTGSRQTQFFNSRANDIVMHAQYAFNRYYGIIRLAQTTTIPLGYIFEKVNISKLKYGRCVDDFAQLINDISAIKKVHSAKSLELIRYEMYGVRWGVLPNAPSGSSEPSAFNLSFAAVYATSTSKRIKQRFSAQADPSRAIPPYSITPKFSTPKSMHFRVNIMGLKYTRKSTGTPQPPKNMYEHLRQAGTGPELWAPFDTRTFDRVFTSGGGPDRKLYGAAQWLFSRYTVGGLKMYPFRSRWYAPLIAGTPIFANEWDFSYFNNRLPANSFKRNTYLIGEFSNVTITTGLPPHPNPGDLPKELSWTPSKSFDDIMIRKQVLPTGPIEILKITPMNLTQRLGMVKLTAVAFDLEPDHKQYEFVRNGEVINVPCLQVFEPAFTRFDCTFHVAANLRSVNTVPAGKTHFCIQLTAAYVDDENLPILTFKFLDKNKNIITMSSTGALQNIHVAWYKLSVAVDRPVVYVRVTDSGHSPKRVFLLNLWQKYC